MKSGKVLLGVLAGIAAGALVGILFAPDKGSRTRRQILDKGGDYAGSVKEKWDDLVEMISKKFETTREEAEQIVANGKAKYEESKKQVKNAPNAPNAANNVSH
jgi:gas vesicle protein